MIKRIFALMLSATLLCAAFAGCTGAKTPSTGKAPSGAAEDGGLGSAPQSAPEGTMYIIINGRALTVKTADNSSADALLGLLSKGDIIVDADDYGGFEKVGALGAVLPTNDGPVVTEPGDVILYQGDKITVYYGTNSWSLTRLGKVQGVSADELKTILGDKNVTMVLSLKKPGDATE